MAAIEWATCHHTISHQDATCQQLIHPLNFQLSATQPCHVSYGLPHQHPYRLYKLYNQHPFFLHVCHFEQNVISLSPDVHLNPNKLCWVHNDEAYAPVRFEAIPSTLNFEQNLIPWITPPHWKDFGPLKDYFQTI
jgi:hypothetical protein